ncbi:hypothetical protein TWF281_006350 [Arthrobotrys megalospora]
MVNRSEYSDGYTEGGIARDTDGREDGGGGIKNGRWMAMVEGKLGSGGGRREGEEGEVTIRAAANLGQGEIQHRKICGPPTTPPMQMQTATMGINSTSHGC